MAEVKPAARPLSPHLQIYRWSWTMAMSVAHRATGAALYGGTLLVAFWLVAAASGPAAYDTAQAIAGSVLGRLVLFGYTFVLLHHMVGGLRHFVWDMGHGYDPQTRMNLAKFSGLVSGVLTLLVWIAAYALR
ncbi:succinate dehydrogenase, cytochrome b556 subunit [Bosea sp. (in: a-proteobacteria)]|uniref:succinate dehydrogenase, cytochrome b556 subunit n=1 Tax=Bosea sp. (in: a-proteobacteria) TaxID=1871050 RepID=UPI000869290D|nr:succinate dehydrogenase, cytochrome b556 subunit [Bosea sp. (in: a-proteobacteria)]MBN9440632.1 succinate dehydrogenase, cytochrome b556 subunit [Bosea sp. (in: a-proteobacteria)]MBN9468610.1 succinate dehydrogenase, cytochrome b556 subunit [Bosea sp. (in: a-proteobacteria)]ODT43908.1 MAG: succinate dehydrogenase, cytochrome b556 subunit [Methylobacterium sp. SCN 67-24]